MGTRRGNQKFISGKKLLGTARNRPLIRGSGLGSEIESEKEGTTLDEALKDGRGGIRVSAGRLELLIIVYQYH